VVDDRLLVEQVRYALLALGPVTVVDAAGNEATVYSQLIETQNAPAVVEAPSVAGPAVVGSTLTGTSGSFSTPSGAGVLSGVSGQWLRCSDATAAHCAPIAQATGVTYQPQAADVGYYLVYSNTVADSDGARPRTPSQR
jgi:hypothetical protein